MTKKKTIGFSHGFDAGNFAAAYEVEPGTADALRKAMRRSSSVPKTKDWKEGFVIGFHSSLELHEIADEELRERVATLRVRYGETD